VHFCIPLKKAYRAVSIPAYAVALLYALEQTVSKNTHLEKKSTCRLQRKEQQGMHFTKKKSKILKITEII